MRILEITAGQTAPIRISLERINDAGTKMVVPNLTGVTPHLTIEDESGLVVFSKDGTVEAPESTSGIVAFAPLSTEVVPPAEGRQPLLCYYQVRTTDAGGEVDFYPKQGERAPCMIHRPLGI